MRSRTTLLVALVLVAVLAVAGSVLALVRTAQLDGSTALDNRALTDAAGSQQVLDRATAAMRALWSYDYRHLDAGARRAARLGTPDFVTHYAAIFKDIDALAPRLRAVVTATVVGAGVTSLQGDRATVVVFLDQRARQQTTGQDSTAGARLRVAMARVDDSWQVAAVTPF